MALTLRNALPGEASGLTDLIMLSKQSNGYDDAFMALCVDELSVSEADIATGRTWVAVDNALLGCVTLTHSDDANVGEISAFFVHPGHKRKGVGRALWHHVLDRAKAASLSKLQLHADPEAVAFYEAVGFRITGQHPSGSIPGRSLPVMEFMV